MFFKWQQAVFWFDSRGTSSLFDMLQLITEDVKFDHSHLFVDIVHAYIIIK